MFARILLLTAALSAHAAAANAWSLVYTRLSDAQPGANPVAQVETAVPAVTARRR